MYYNEGELVSHGDIHVHTSVAGKIAPSIAQTLNVVWTPSGLINHPLAVGTVGS